MLCKYQNFFENCQAKITKTKLILTPDSIVYHSDTSDCINQQYLVIEVLVKSGIGAALLYVDTINNKK